MKRGVTVLRRLEEERLGQLSSVSRLFLGIMMTNRYVIVKMTIIIVMIMLIRPKMIALTERLREPVDLCNVARDSEVSIETSQLRFERHPSVHKLFSKYVG